jgi:hypothetical protein
MTSGNRPPAPPCPPLPCPPRGWRLAGFGTTASPGHQPRAGAGPRPKVRTKALNLPPRLITFGGATEPLPPRPLTIPILSLFPVGDQPPWRGGPGAPWWPAYTGLFPIRRPPAPGAGDVAEEREVSRSLQAAPEGGHEGGQTSARLAPSGGTTQVPLAMPLTTAIRSLLPVGGQQPWRGGLAPLVGLHARASRCARRGPPAIGAGLPTLLPDQFPQPWHAVPDLPPAKPGR